MGTLKKVAHADYSQVAIGKYDFRQNIFRRKVSGGLERNYASLKTGFLEGYAPIDLSGNYYVGRTSFIYARHGGDHRVFSVADYASKRALNIAHMKQTASIYIQFWFMIDTTAYSYILDLPIDVDSVLDFECEYVIDFENKKLVSIIVNGVSYLIPTVGTTTNENAWTNEQTRTICCGQVANYANGTNAPRAYVYFAQLSDANNNILLHFDFLGDNEIEILTDKAQMITLKKGSAVQIISKPIEL